MDGRTYGRTETTDRRTDGWTYGWTDGRTDGWMDGQIPIYPHHWVLYLKTFRVGKKMDGQINLAMTG